MYITKCITTYFIFNLFKAIKYIKTYFDATLAQNERNLKSYDFKTQGFYTPF